MIRTAPIRNWRTEIEYVPNERKIIVHDTTLEFLIGSGLMERPIMRCGESMGNCLICGIGIDYTVLNVHPASVSKRFMLELKADDEHTRPGY